MSRYFQRFFCTHKIDLNYLILVSFPRKKHTTSARKLQLSAHESKLDRIEMVCEKVNLKNLEKSPFSLKQEVNNKKTYEIIYVYYLSEIPSFT